MIRMNRMNNMAIILVNIDYNLKRNSARDKMYVII